MNIIEKDKEMNAKKQLDYRCFLLNISQIWQEITQRDDTKGILYSTMDTLLGEDKADHRIYKYWFSEPDKNLWNLQIPDSKKQYRAWCMISAIQEATLAMIEFYENIINETTVKLNRAASQLKGIDCFLESLTPNIDDNENN